jgi:hypothetical protein
LCIFLSDYYEGRKLTQEDSSSSSTEEEVASNVPPGALWEKMQSLLYQDLDPASVEPQKVVVSAFRSFKVAVPKDDQLKQWITGVSDLQKAIDKKNALWLHTALQVVVEAAKTRGKSAITMELSKTFRRILRKLANQLLPELLPLPVVRLSDVMKKNN